MKLNLFRVLAVIFVIVFIFGLLIVEVEGSVGGVVGLSWLDNLFGGGITGKVVDLNDGLIAYYDFEGDVLDNSGNEN